MSKGVEKEVYPFKRTLLEDRLNRCTEKQKSFFKKIFPAGVPESKLMEAINLCDRTIRKNIENPERDKGELCLNQLKEMARMY
mgnify:CR=1 FL=1